MDCLKQGLFFVLISKAPAGADCNPSKLIPVARLIILSSVVRVTQKTDDTWSITSGNELSSLCYSICNDPFRTALAARPEPYAGYEGNSGQDTMSH